MRRREVVSFEVDIGDVLYDCDASVSPASGEAELLEVRIVGDDGLAFEVAAVESLDRTLVLELVRRATAALDLHVEAQFARHTEEGLLGPG